MIHVKRVTLYSEIFLNYFKAKYEASSIAFLLNEDDTVHAYEERGKKKRGTTSDYDEGLKALSSMNRIQQVEVVQGTDAINLMVIFVTNTKIICNIRPTCMLG